MGVTQRGIGDGDRGAARARRRRRSALVLLLALVNTAVCLVVQVQPAHADEDLSGYPHAGATPQTGAKWCNGDLTSRGKCPASSGQIADEWRFYRRECTSFVAWRLNATNKAAFNNDYDNNGSLDFGNASNWKLAATNLGIAVDKSPAPGAVAWFDANSSRPSGHVAWVKAVSGDRKKVSLEEYNRKDDHSFGERTIDASDVTNFIHIKDLTAGPTKAPIDLIFVVDTTSSMRRYIENVVDVADDIVGLLVRQSIDYRIGVVDYKDADSCSDYDAQTLLAFSTDSSAIVSAIASLPGRVGGGCDDPEDVLSGLMRAIRFPWRNGVKKSIILMGDQPPKDPEPHTGFTSASVIAAAEAVDPAVIYPVLVGDDSNATTALKTLASGTGGTTFNSAISDAGQAVLNAIDLIIESTLPDFVATVFPSEPSSPGSAVVPILAGLAFLASLSVIVLLLTQSGPKQPGVSRCVCLSVLPEGSNFCDLCGRPAGGRGPGAGLRLSRR